MPDTTAEHRPGPRRRRATVLLVIGVVVAAIALISAITPWPSAMAIRWVFTKGADSTVEEMLPHVPAVALDERIGLSYAEDGGIATTYDVFRPAAASEAFPTVVWIHGGAWISGAKEDVAPYLRIIAAEGYTTVGLNYPVAPEDTYPLAVTRLNDALAHLLENATELGIDTERMVLAGDSAGAQLVSQLAVLSSNGSYAELMGMDPALDRDQLDAVILHCGVYDLRAMAELNGITSWGFKTALWGYTGTREWSDTSAGATMSSIEFVTEDFAPTFISGGNGDRLTWIQSVPMANRLAAAGVETTTLFWPAQHEPALPHEYQFHLDLDEAQEALAATLRFLDGVTSD